MTLEVRRAGTADLDAVLDLEHAGFGSDAWPSALVGSGVAGEVPTTVYLVAVDDREVVGYAAVSAVAEIAELQRIVVRPERRRHGVATALVEEGVGECRRGGADRVLLEVRADNRAARALYETLNFVEIDRRERYYRDGATAVVLRLDLMNPDPT